MGGNDENSKARGGKDTAFIFITIPLLFLTQFRPYLSSLR
jgi:hypothetical protein